MGREKGEEEDSGELGGMGWVGWRKGGYGSREVNILIKGAILRFARDLTLEGFPGPRRGPQIVPWAAEERVHELSMSHSHTDEYIAYHHRTIHLAMDGVRDRDPHWSTGLSPQGPNEEQKERGNGKGCQECVHPLIQGD